MLTVTHVLCYVDDGVENLRCVWRVQGALSGRTGGGDGQVTVETYLPVGLPSAHCVHVCVCKISETVHLVMHSHI